MSLRLAGHRALDVTKRRNSDRGPRRSSAKQSFPDVVLETKTEHNNGHETFHCDEFDEILDMVGSEGKLQKQLLYGFILPYIAVMPLFLLPLLFMLYEPNHWCHVPGKPEDISEDAWKNLTIPREKSGDHAFSKCTMFVPGGNGNITECAHGWDYDRSDYKETLPSYLNWVCTKGYYVTTIFTIESIGSFAGTPIYGLAGDKIGRKLVFFFICILNTTARGISIFIPQYFTAFLFIRFLNGTSFPMIYLIPLTILMEISSENYRSWIYASVWMIWVIGICLLPLVAWLCADWFLIGVVTWFPGLMVFVYYKMLPESPRWLVTMGRMDEAKVIIQKIADVNGTASKFKEGQLEGMLSDLRKKQLKADEKTPQVWDLFRQKRLAAFTLLLGLVWSMNGLVYYGITLNTTSMAGNQFLNFFYLAIIELPAGILGRYLVEKVGRRWSQVGFFILCAIGFGLAAVGIMSKLPQLVIVAVVISKFSVAFTSLVVNLQSNEIFPTQLRASGNGFVGTLAALIGIAAPTIIYLRNFHEGAPYIAMGIISIIGFASCAFIPETLGQSLPETIEDSNNLGRNTKFWSFLPKDYKNSNNHGEINKGLEA